MVQKIINIYLRCINIFIEEIVKPNALVNPDHANESDGEGSSSADEGYRTTSSSSGCSDSR